MKNKFCFSLNMSWNEVLCSPFIDPIQIIFNEEKKTILDAFNGSLSSILVEGGHSYSNCFKGGHLKKKVWETLL